MIGITGIDHIGIAVHNLAEARKLYEGVLGLTPLPEELPPGMGVRVAKYKTGDSAVELLEAASPDGAVGKFLSQRGEGIHHICFRVRDLAAAVASLRGKGFQTIWPEPRVGAAGRRVQFLHPKVAHGVLVELAEAVGD